MTADDNIIGIEKRYEELETEGNIKKGDVQSPSFINYLHLFIF